MRYLVAALLLLAAGAGAAAREGDDLIGRLAPPLGKLAWVQGHADDADRRGKVTLIRWWTDGCTLCQRTAPALNALDSEFGKRGLVVVGVYHPKPPGKRPEIEIREAAHRLGFRFAVAADPDWTALRRWWLDGGEREYTSVSFVVDRRGHIRYVHPGGEYFPSRRPEDAQANRDYAEIRSTVRTLIAEK